MSNCCSVASTLKSLEQPISCIQYPLTKAALFVIAFLLAGGAAASYFAALGIAAIVSFSFASLAVLVTASIIAARCPSPPPIEELVLSLPSSYDYLSPREKWKLTSEELKTCRSLSPHLKAMLGENPNITALQSMVDLMENNPNKFYFLIEGIIENSQVDLRSTALILEQLQWPKAKIKENVITKALSIKLLGYFDWKKRNESSATVSINMDKVFGDKDFNMDPESIPYCLSLALGISIRRFFCNIQDQLEQKKSQGQKRQEIAFDLKLCFQASETCRLPASVIIPALHYCIHLPQPYFTSMDLEHVGREKGFGFQDEDVALLLNIFLINRRLVELNVNTESMSQEKRKEFEKEKERILESRQ